MITNRTHSYCAKGGHRMPTSSRGKVCFDHQGPGGYTHCVRCGGDILREGDGTVWSPDHGKCTLGHERCYCHDVCPPGEKTS